jgi:steroid delta-isomerase-like uncharacterized protein
MPINATTHQLLCHFMVEKVFNEGELELLDLLMSPDAINHELEIFGPSAARGPEAVRQFIRVFRSAFPDLQVTVIDQLGDGDRVATRWKMEGTQTNRLMGIEATNRSMSVEGIRIDRIANGRIVETWNRWDTLEMLRQLGAAPPLERRPEMAFAPVSHPVSVAA